MPVYEYKCHTCGKEFEYTQRISENSLSVCPVGICEMEIKGTGNVERKISRNIGLVFKGSGFYLTDYSKKKSVPSSVSEKMESSKDTKLETITNPSEKPST